MPGNYSFEEFPVSSELLARFFVKSKRRLPNQAQQIIVTANAQPFG